MSLGGDYRRADSLRETTAKAPDADRRRVELLRGLATERKVLLLDCAICRHAPFSLDGRTIWELLPGFRWFQWWRVSALNEEPPRSLPITAHQAIEIVERRADGEHTLIELNDAHEYLQYTEYAAEADRFGYDASVLPGSELRYGVAYWIDCLAQVSSQIWNVFDFYITAYQGIYYAWARTEPLHPYHRTVVLTLIEDIFGNPFRPVAFDAEWRTDTAVSLAQGMYDSRDFGAMPILADALQDAGCDNEAVLHHCRDAKQPHVRGCWVTDLVLGKS
jgi:hypothetical protein